MARGQTARLFLAIGADVRDASRSLRLVRGDLGELRRDAKRSADAWTGFVGTLARTGQAIRGVREIARSIRDIGGAIGGLALDASDDRVALDQLIGAIKNTGRVVDDDLRRKLEDTLDTMEATTLFTDNDLRQALQVLVVGTGNVDEAFDRLGISADLAAREEIGLAQAARMLARVDENSLSVLNRYGIGLEEAAENSGELAAAQLLASRAGTSVQGALKAIGNESVRKRWGIPDPKDFRGAVNEAALLAQAREKLAGGATGKAAGLRGEADQVAKGWQRIREQIGEFVMPLANRGLRFLSKGLTGVRRLIMLFSTDISGPRIGGVRKLWKEIFGTEMPKALGAVVDGFTAISARISKFVEDLNSTDDETVRGAIKALFEGLKNDVSTALASFGAELDKEGLPGIAIKLGIASIALDKVTGGLIGPAQLVGMLKDALQIAWLTVALGGTGPLLTIAAAGVLAVGAFVLADQVQRGINSQQIWDKVMAPALAGIIGITALFTAGASLPLTLTVGAAIVLAFGAMTFSTEIGDIIGGWWSDFQDAWERARADFITWWNTTLPDWMPKLATPTTGTGGKPIYERKDRPPVTVGGLSVPATLDDIARAYARVTGGSQISADYANAVLGQGFTAQQAAMQNIFTGTVPPAMPGGGGEVISQAIGGSGVVTQPTLFMAGDRGAEQYKFTPVGRGGAGVGGGGGLSIGSIVIGGNVDSRARVTELGAEFQMRMARLQGSTA